MASCVSSRDQVAVAGGAEVRLVLDDAAHAALGEGVALLPAHRASLTQLHPFALRSNSPSTTGPVSRVGHEPPGRPRA